MERERTHILAIPYPSQGHINPLLQFCQRLVLKGTKPTLILTKFIVKSFNPNSATVAIDTISDAYDDGGFSQAKDVDDYLTQMECAGSKTLEDLIQSYQKSNQPIDCIVYDAFLPWALDVAQKYGIKGAAFFSQACAVNYVYYYIHHGLLKLPVEEAATPVELPGLPPLHLPNFPSFIYVHGSYPAYFKMVLNQFSNSDKADFLLINTFYKLEDKIVLLRLLAVGSCVLARPAIVIFPDQRLFLRDQRCVLLRFLVLLADCASSIVLFHDDFSRAPAKGADIEMKDYVIKELTMLEEGVRRVGGSDMVAPSREDIFERFYGRKIPQAKTVLPPLIVKAKGSGNRLKSRKEKAQQVAKKPLRRCSRSKQMGRHDARNCKVDLEANESESEGETGSASQSERE